MRHKCPYCHQEVRKRRRSQIYCCPSCKVMAARKRKESREMRKHGSDNDEERNDTSISQ